MTIEGATHLPTLTFERFPLSPFVRTWDHSLAWFRSSRRLQTSGKHIADREGARCSHWFARLQECKMFFWRRNKTMERRCPVPNTKTNFNRFKSISRARLALGALFFPGQPGEQDRQRLSLIRGHRRAQLLPFHAIQRNEKKKKNGVNRPIDDDVDAAVDERPRRGPLCPSPTSLSA